MLICQNAEGVHGQRKVGDPGLVVLYQIICYQFCICIRLSVLLFYVIGVAAGKFFGVRRIFARISPNLPEKFLFDFYRQIFSQKDHEDLF